MSRKRNGQRGHRHAAKERKIGSAIRQRRLEIDMSQTTLGKRIGVTFQQVQKYEKGINRVAATTLFEIALVLKCRMTDLMPFVLALVTAI